MFSFRIVWKLYLVLIKDYRFACAIIRLDPANRSSYLA